MSSQKLGGLLQPIIAKETEYGVAPITDFTAVNGWGFAQSKDTPIDVNVINNYSIVESTTGSNMAHENHRQKGVRTCTGNASHMIGSNDMMLLLSMYFQNAYTYTPTIANNTISDITVVSTTATVTVADIGTLADGDAVVISGSSNSDEDGVYVIGNVTASTYDILNVDPTFDGADTTRVIDAVYNKHTSMIEYHDPDEIICYMRKLDSSFTWWMPKLWDKNDCSVGAGELVTGVIGNSISMDFMESSYSIDIQAQDVKNDTTNFPTKSTQYNKPVSFDALMDKNNTYLLIDGVEQNNTIELSLDITMGVDDTVKSRKGRYTVENNTDGVLVEGSYKVLLKDEYEETNISYQILQQRDDIQNGKVMTFGIEDENGSSLKFTGKAMFGDVVTAKELNGTTLTVPFTIMVADSQQNFVMESYNGYNQNMSEFFRTELPLV